MLAGPEAETAKAQEPTGGAKAVERRSNAERRAALAPLRRKLEAVEARMAKLSAAIAKIDTALADGTAFRTDAAKAGELARMRARPPRLSAAPRRSGWR